MYLLETANIIFLSFIWLELLSFEHGNPISHKMLNIILWLFCKDTIKFSFTQRYSISFPFIFHTLCSYLESLTCFHRKDLIVQSMYVHLKDRKAGWRSSHVHAICNSQYMCMAVVLFFRNMLYCSLFTIT